MKRDPIQRLLAAASRCPSKSAPAQVPWAVEAKVMGYWRSLGNDEAIPPWIGWLRNALAASFLMAAASLILYMYLPQGQSQHELALADSLIQNQLWP